MALYAVRPFDTVAIDAGWLLVIIIIIIIIIIFTFFGSSEAQKTPKILPFGTFVKYV